LIPLLSSLDAPQCAAGSWYISGDDDSNTEMMAFTTMNGKNKTNNAKDDKAARPGGKLDLLFPDINGGIILRSASIKPNTWRPKVRVQKEKGGEEKGREKGRRGKTTEFSRFLSLLYISISLLTTCACKHPPTLLPTSIICYPQVVADTSFFEDIGLVLFALPEDEITQLKTYTAIFKFRLGDDWKSGDIVPFFAGTQASTDNISLNVIVR